jgi:hypothetical protein
LALKAIREKVLAEHEGTKDVAASIQTIDEEFAGLYERFGSIQSKLEHLHKKIKHVVDPPKPPGQMDEEETENS